MAGGSRTRLSKGKRLCSGSVMGVGLCQEQDTQPISSKMEVSKKKARGWYEHVSGI